MTGTPTSVVAASTGRTVTVTYTPGAGQTGVKLYRAVDDALSAWALVTSDVTLAPVTDFVAAYGTYHYRIVGSGPGGDSAPSAVVTAHCTPLTGPFVLDHVPVLAGAYNREHFTGTANTEIADWTITTKFTVGTIEYQVGGGAKCVGGAAAYIRDLEGDRGRIGSCSFRYSSQPANGDVLMVGHKITEGAPGEFCGMTATLVKAAGDDNFHVRYDEWTNDTPTKAWDSDPFVLAANTDWEFGAVYIGGIPNLPYYGSSSLRIYVHDGDTFTPDDGTGYKCNGQGDGTWYGNHPPSTAWQTHYFGPSYNGLAYKTLLGILDANILVTWFDNCPDGWFAMQPAAFCDHGDWTTPHADDSGDYWATVAFSSNGSRDQQGLLRSSDLHFADAGRMFKGVSGVTGVIIGGGEPLDETNNVYPSGFDNGWAMKAWLYCCMYDPDEDLYKVWFGADGPGTVLRVGYAYASPDAGGAPPTDPDDWTYHADNPLDLSTDDTGLWEYGFQTVKRSSVHAEAAYQGGFVNEGVTYDYVAVYTGGDGYGATDKGVYLAFSQTGEPDDWVRTERVLTPGGFHKASKLGWEPYLGKWFMLLDFNLGGNLFHQRLYVSDDLRTWELATAELLPTGIPVDDEDAYKRDVMPVLSGSDLILSYAGDPENGKRWPDLKGYQSVLTLPEPEPVKTAVAGASLEWHSARAALGTGPPTNSPLTTSWHDLSGSGYHGTLTGFAGSEASGWDGSGATLDPHRLVLDGSDDVVQLASAASLNMGLSDWTAEVWCSLPVLADNTGNLIGKGPSSNAGAWGLRHYPGEGPGYGVAAFFAWGNYPDAAITALHMPTAGIMTHYVASYDRDGMMRFYVNGNLIGTGTDISAHAATNMTNAFKVNLGNFGAAFMQFDVALVRVYPKALTAAEVSQNFAARLAIPPLVAGAEVLTAYPGLASGGTVVDESNGDVTARGVCWNRAGSPTPADAHTDDGTGPGAFTSGAIGGLAPGRYFIRAYATNAAGSGYGTESSFQSGSPRRGRQYVSLLVGSDALGWQELGADAQLGQMTKAMPGGDGSLEWTLAGDAAWKHRNVLIAGAEVVLDTGDDQWGGLIVGDPMAGYYAAQPVVSVAAAGLWSHAANRRDVAYVWVDSDTSHWQRKRQKYDGSELVDLEGQSKFTSDTEGRLYIRADKDRAFQAYAQGTLAYWLLDGIVDPGCRIFGLEASLKCNLPDLSGGGGGPWELHFRVADYPWQTTSLINSGADAVITASRAAWTTFDTTLDLDTPSRCLFVMLYRNAGGDGGADEVASDPWVWIRSVRVLCRMDGASVDRAVTLDKAMGDLATLSGLATVARTETIGSSRDQLAFAPEFEKSVADDLRELAAMHSAPVEQFFDRAAGAWRYTCGPLPNAVDPTRNRHWVLDGGRAGEDTSGIVRDPEATPEYLRVLYRSSGVATMPNGRQRSYCYPAEPPDFVSNVSVNTDQADVKMTDAQAADVASRLYGQMNAAAFSGSALLPDTAITVAGQELPSRLMRPGDRVNILGRDCATDLYVSETSYDWSSGQMSVTVGWPFDIEAARRSLPSRHLVKPGGLGAAAVWAGGRPYRSWRR